MTPTCNLPINGVQDTKGFRKLSLTPRTILNKSPIPNNKSIELPSLGNPSLSLIFLNLSLTTGLGCSSQAAEEMIWFAKNSFTTSFFLRCLLKWYGLKVISLVGTEFVPPPQGVQIYMYVIGFSYQHNLITGTYRNEGRCRASV